MSDGQRNHQRPKTPGLKALSTSLALAVVAGVCVSSVQSSTASPRPNLVANPGFETSLNGWAPSSGPRHIDRVTKAHRGDFAVRLSTDRTANVGLKDTPSYTVTAGEQLTKYRARAWAMPTGAPLVATIRIREVSGGTVVGRHSKSVRLDTGVWTRMRVRYVAKLAGSSIGVKVRTRDLTPGRSLLIDDVALVSTGSAAADSISVPPSPSTAPTPTPSRSAAAPTKGAISVLDFGAAGDGVTDDTKAIQKALDALHRGDTLEFPGGHTFRHTDVLRVGVPEVRITGRGVLLATNESRSAFFVDADSVTVDGGLTFRMGPTTKRWDAYEQMKLRIGRHSNVSIRGITIDGSAAAGLFIGGADHFDVTDVTVQNTRADAIHMTGGAHDGRVTGASIQNPGDDGVAVVSYVDGNPVCRDIAIVSPKLTAQTWGRAFSVVGGQDITWRDVYADGSGGASIYVAAESEWNTYGAKRITFDGGTLKRSNQTSSIDHGAILIYDAQPQYPNSSITIRNLNIVDTRSNASRQVGVLSNKGAVQEKISFENIRISGGPKSFFSTNGPASAYNLVGWSVDGGAKTDHIGWQ